MIKKDNRGLGIVEYIIVLAVLIGLLVIFRDSIAGF
jgi:competence protein ComGC